jgi:hypothetical protein
MPLVFVNTARNSQLFAAATSVPDSVADVQLGTLVHVTALFVDSCHWTAGVGEPLAAAEKETVLPMGPDWLRG